jgi:NADH dehydrogenase
LVLIDENDYHQFLYKIHEVCNKEYEEKDILVPLEKIIDMSKIDFKQTTVKSVNVEKKVVETQNGEEPYDILAVCLGSHPSYFNIEGAQKYSLTLGSFEQAKQIRAKIIELFEKSEGTEESIKIVIGGGGFSGVELAGELAEWLPVLYEKYSIQKPDTLVTIIEALPTILPGWDEKLCLEAQEILERKGVELILNDPISSVSEHSVEIKSGLVLNPDLFIWTAGVEGDPACGYDFEIKGRRIRVDEYCRAVDFKNIYVGGDSACAVNHEDVPQPPTAHIAMEQGNIIAHNILAQLRGDQLRKYEFDRVGEIVTLGRTHAVGDLFGLRFRGFLAKLMKKMVHYWYLHSIGGIKLLTSI